MGEDVSGEIKTDQTGAGVSLSHDGSRMAVGTPNADNGDAVSDAGKVHVYDWNATAAAWEQIGGDVWGVAEKDKFGQSVSLSGDGARFAAGAHLNDDGGDAAGHVRVYQYDADADAWTAIGTVADGTVLDGEAAADESGFCVSLSEDGERVAVGAPQNDAGGLDAAGHGLSLIHI